MSLFKSKSFYLGAFTALLASSAAVSIASNGFSPKPLTFAQAPQSLQADAGPEQVISEVKSSIIDKFEALQWLAQLPAATQKEIGSGTDSQASRSLLAHLETIWVANQANKAHSDLVQLYAAEAGKFPQPTWNGVEVIVEKWQGVQVDGNIATALFESHTQFANDESTWTDNTVQWQVTMQFDKALNVWKLASRTGTRLEE